MTRIHLRAGLSDIEWFRRATDEATRDPVGMWQMVKAGRDGFGLTGLALDDFVREFIIELVKSGAVPVIGDRAAKFGWRPLQLHGADPKSLADSLVDDWHRAKSDPDVDGVWFAAPSVWQ